MAVREALSRIDRNQAEFGKLLAEQPKLLAEQAKLVAEQSKLAAEQANLAAEPAKMNRGRSWYPLQVAIALMAAEGALVGGTVALMRILGE